MSNVFTLKWKIYFLLGLPLISLILIHPNLRTEALLVRISGLYGVIGIWMGLWQSKPEPRLGWGLLSFGTTVNLVGDLIYTEMYYLNNPLIDPTNGVLIYTIGLICSISGLGLIILSIRHQINRDSIIQGLIITIGFFSLIWLIQIGPGLDFSKDLFVLVKDAVIPLGLVVAIAICCIPLATQTGRTWSFRLTFIASLLFVLGAFLQSIGTRGEWPTPFAHTPPSELIFFSDFAFGLAYLTLASALLHPSIRTFRNPTINPNAFPRDEYYLLGISFFLTPAAFLIQSIRHKPSDPVFVILSSCVIFFLVMLRLSSLFHIVFIQNRQLNQQRNNLHFMAFHDKLTGLPNRTFLDNFLAHALERAHHGQMGAVLMIDLNHFKAINDNFGHYVGDQVLCEITQQLTEFKRHNDILGRWGGDEFLFVIEGLQSSQDALNFALRIKNMVHTSRRIGDQEFLVSLSIGICVFPIRENDLPTILKYADKALYDAKADDLDSVAIYAEDIASNRLQDHEPQIISSQTE